MISPGELIPDKLKSITKIRERAEVMTCAQMKIAIRRLDRASEKWENKQSSVNYIIHLLLAGVIGALISNRGFAEALNNLNLMKMLHINPLSTIAVFILPICIWVYLRYRSYKLNSALEQKILIDCLLEKIE